MFVPLIHHLFPLAGASGTFSATTTVTVATAVTPETGCSADLTPTANGTSGLRQINKLALSSAGVGVQHLLGNRGYGSTCHHSLRSDRCLGHQVRPSKVWKKSHVSPQTFFTK
ncbi:unnamed protein product [Lota lota]